MSLHPLGVRCVVQNTKQHPFLIHAWSVYTVCDLFFFPVFSEDSELYCTSYQNGFLSFTNVRSVFHCLCFVVTKVKIQIKSARGLFV